MIREVRIVTVIIISIIVFSPIISTHWALDEISDLENNSSISSSFFESLLEDPFLENEPQVTVNGTSGEFSSSYHSRTGGADVSYIQMNWTHVANTVLDFRGVDPEDVLPDYNDFIYTYQEFEFPYEIRPSNAEISLNYSVHLTGDFAPGIQEGNNLMFKVYVWVIDSSGNWYRIYASREDVYSDEYEQKYLALNYFHLVDIFDGMIEEEGVQEDPSDTATLAIGLAPTYRFDSYLATEPWTFYDGSVALRVSYADMYVAMEIPADPSTIWQPEYNETFGTTIGDAIPLHENASDEVLDECYGMDVGPDGSVYVTGNSRTSYEYTLQGLRYRNQFLIKYNPSLDLVWVAKNDNRTQVRSMYIHDGYIYTTGYIDRDETGRNLIVTKWSSSGDRIWQSEWGGEYSQLGVAVGVQSNGSIYVICSDYNMDEPYYHRTSILNFDTNGNFLWNRTSLYFWTLYDASGNIIIFDDFFELHLNSGIGGGRYYFNGTESHRTFGVVVAPDEEGGCYAATWSGSLGMGTTIVYLAHFNSVNDSGWFPTADWNANYSVSWPNGWGYSLVPKGLIISPDDKLHLLVQHTVFSDEFLLLTYDLDGNLLENRTIGDENWPHYSAPIFIEVGKSGLVYFAFTIYGDTIDTADVCVQAFKFYETGGSFNLDLEMVIIIASTVVIIGAGAGILQWKRKQLIGGGVGIVGLVGVIFYKRKGAT